MNQTTNPVDPALLREARKRMGMKNGLRIHATVFVLVNIGLALINFTTSRAVPWSMFPFLGWGLGLAIHALAVRYVLSDKAARDLNDEVARLQERERNKP
jgi:Flp pilus assembly protein TadB